MFYYYDYPTIKGAFKKIKKRKSRTELKKDLQKERDNYEEE